MKSLRITLSLVVILLSSLAFAQSDAQKSFDKLKTLAGSWEGTYDGKPVHISLRVTSMGNALMHEMRMGGRDDDPITMFYLDGDRLLLTHYCDAGNRPRMTGKMSPDGKSLEFNFLDIANASDSQGGNMQHALLTMLDPDHHTEDWTFMMQGNKPMKVRLDLERTK